MSGIIGANTGRSSGLTKTVAVSQDLVKIASGSMGAASTLDIDNVFDASDDYKVYKIFFTHVDFSAGNAPMCGRMLLTSDGSAYTSSYYSHVQQQNYRTSTSTSEASHGAWNQDRWTWGAWDHTDNDDSARKGCGEFTFYDPTHGTNHKWVHYRYSHYEQANNYFVDWSGACTLNVNSQVFRGFRIYNNGGHNFNTDAFWSAYGLKH